MVQFVYSVNLFFGWFGLLDHLQEVLADYRQNQYNATIAWKLLLLTTLLLSKKKWLSMGIATNIP